MSISGWALDMYGNTDLHGISNHCVKIRKVCVPETRLHILLDNHGALWSETITFLECYLPAQSITGPCLMLIWCTNFYQPPTRLSKKGLYLYGKIGIQSVFPPKKSEEIYKENIKAVEGYC